MLILGLSLLVLLGAAALGLVLWRVVRGNFARAYDTLARTEARLERLVGQLPAIVYALELGEDGRSARTLYVSPQVEQITGVHFSEMPPALHVLAAHVPEEDRRRIAAELKAIAAGGAPQPIDFRFEKPGGELIWLRDSEPTVDGRQLHGLLFDVTDEKRAEVEREQMELELRLAQKLESVGELAAGIAHEINTPIQFVGDTIGSWRTPSTTFSTAPGATRTSCTPPSGPRTCPPELLARVQEAEERADLDVSERAGPDGVRREADGVARVATIVRAMRLRASADVRAGARRPQRGATERADRRGAASSSTWPTSRPTLGDLPVVPCDGGDAQPGLPQPARQRRGRDRGAARANRQSAGAIRIRTWLEGDSRRPRHRRPRAAASPTHILDRVFDPFFTTKDVGRGTGQGLAIARTLVVERHAGTLNFETEPGGGTTFEMRLPIGGLQFGHRCAGRRSIRAIRAATATALATLALSP